MSWNIVVVVSDTLRTAYLSPYGNDWVHTPKFSQVCRGRGPIYQCTSGMFAYYSDAPHTSYRQTCLSI